MWGVSTFRRWRSEWAEYWLWAMSWPILLYLDTFGKDKPELETNEDWARWAKKYWQLRYMSHCCRTGWWINLFFAILTSGILLYTVSWGIFHPEDRLPDILVYVASGIYVFTLFVWSGWASRIPPKDILLCNACNISSNHLYDILQKFPEIKNGPAPGWTHPTRRLVLRKEFLRYLFSLLPVLFVLLEQEFDSGWLVLSGLIALFVFWHVWGALARLSYPLVRYRLPVEGPDEFCVRVFRDDLEEVCRGSQK
ncbi:MAG: hypothetical protein AB7T01_02110 [Acidithiobacillus sp.]